MAKINDWLENDKIKKKKGWARGGITDEQIAKNMGIAPSTLYEWKKKSKEFSESLKKGKELIDFEVENALLKRALGYEYEEETYENGILTKKVKKHVAPDTTAQIFWLKNRKPSSCKDKVETDEDREAVANASQVIAKIRKVAQEYTDGTNRN